MKTSTPEAGLTVPNQDSGSFVHDQSLAADPVRAASAVTRQELLIFSLLDYIQPAYQAPESLPRRD